MDEHEKEERLFNIKSEQARELLEKWDDAAIKMQQHVEEYLSKMPEGFCQTAFAERLIREVAHHAASLQTSSDLVQLYIALGILQEASTQLRECITYEDCE